VVEYTEEQIKRVEESIRIRREAKPVELVQAVLLVDNLVHLIDSWFIFSSQCCKLIH
jgi:hypothetical protein